MKVWKIDRICVPTLEDFERVLNEHEKAGHVIRNIIPLIYDGHLIYDGQSTPWGVYVNMNIGNYQIIYTQEEGA